jgi:hypothetical protein
MRKMKLSSHKRQKLLGFYDIQMFLDFVKYFEDGLQAVANDVTYL